MYYKLASIPLVARCQEKEWVFWPCRFSEPALDYNAGLILALSPLVNFYKGLGPFDECGLDFGYAFPGAPPPPESLVAVCGPTSTAAGHTAAAVPTVQP